MNSGEWSVFLHSKIRGRDYENIAGLIQAAEKWVYRYKEFFGILAGRIQRLTPHSRFAFVLAEHGNELMLGVYGPVGSVLGENHPQAWDRADGTTHGGRVKPFFLGYTAPKGTSVPSSADLKNLDETLRADLERLFEEAERICPSWKNSKPFVTNLASSEATSENMWDGAVRTLQAGRALNGLVTFRDGESEFTKISEPPREMKSSTESDKTMDKTAKIKKLWSRVITWLGDSVANYR